MTSFIIFIMLSLGLGEEHKEQLDRFQNSSEYSEYEKEWEETDRTIITFDDLEEY